MIPPSHEATADLRYCEGRENPPHCRAGAKKGWGEAARGGIENVK